MAEVNPVNHTGDAGEIVQFARLGLSVGSSLTIETLSPHRKYIVRLLGYSEGRSVMVSCPLREGKEVLLDKNAQLTVRLLEGKNVCAFETSVLYRSIQPYGYYHLRYPDAVESLQIRDSERIETFVSARVDSDFDIVGEWPKLAEINNLSKSGARIASSEYLGDPGHELILEFDLPLSDMVKRMYLTGIIRNVNSKADLKGLMPYVVGIQFVDLSDETLLTLANYIYESGTP